MTESAQSAFKRLLRDVAAPELRRQGLKGSGSAYVLPHAASWAQVGFQKSTSSTSDVVKFTINLKVTDKDHWDERRRDHSPMKDTPPPGVDRTTWDAERLARSAYPTRPAANLFGDGQVERIGRLIPGIEGDHWWSLTVDDAERVVADACRALLIYGLPWLRRALAVTDGNQGTTRPDGGFASER
ncbi:MAG: hypothetical protein QOG43_1063 [Actinomycetota bacterium]|jgi:hypothetical protein|nr:hypothetical protein [Actinomycetota bacterium]